MVIADTMDGVGSLEEQALKRKERLKNLKRKNTNDDSSSSKSDAVQLPKSPGKVLKRKERLKNLKRKNTNDDSSSSKSDAVQLPKPKFRSYKPQDESLQEVKLADAEPPAVDEQVKDLLEAGKEKVVLQDLDISSLAPRKPDWDLKRDVAKKLEKLERRTQKAIAELIWERLKHGTEENLGAIMTMTDNKATDDD